MPSHLPKFANKYESFYHRHYWPESQWKDYTIHPDKVQEGENWKFLVFIMGAGGKIITEPNEDTLSSLAEHIDCHTDLCTVEDIIISKKVF